MKSEDKTVFKQQKKLKTKTVEFVKSINLFWTIVIQTINLSPIFFLLSKPGLVF